MENPNIPTRRAFLRSVPATAVALSLPAVPSQATIAQQTDAEIVEQSILQLREALGRMHPIVDNIEWGWSTQSDGTFRLTISGSRPYLSYQGQGWYEISLSGCVDRYWLQRDDENRAIGEHERFLGLQRYGKKIYEREFCGPPNIIRKLGSDWSHIPAVQPEN